MDSDVPDLKHVAEYADREIILLHDPNVPFEEYLHYAKLSRANEERLYGPDSDYAKTNTGPVSKYVQKIPGIPGKSNGNTTVTTYDSSEGSPNNEKSEGTSDPWSVITEKEWYHASRAARTATWSAVFFLITTDILGPFNVPYAFTQLGWGPGIVLYTIFGGLAGYSGWQLWVIFLGLDSDRYPIKNYGDFAFRVYGQWFRYTCNILQSLQFFLNVGLIIISTAQSISEVSAGATGEICFIACTIIAMASGLIVGQIRTLARFGWLAQVAVLLNVLTIIFTMAVANASHPNYKAVQSTSPSLIPDINHPPPVQTSAGVPPGLTFRDNINGLFQAVFAFGGATLFCEIMAEMRRPMDFWKGFMLADVFIYCLYILFGGFMYGIQGQYAYNPAYQGVANSEYGWQTAGNVMQILSSIIAACLYGNIGIKVLYNNVGRELLKFPLLESKRGKWIWVIFVPVYWIVAWAVASSIPQFSNFTALVGALCIAQFTYTFPPFLITGFRIQRDAILPEEKFDPATGQVERSDSGFSRWMRGYKKVWFLNTWDIIYSLGALTTAILGIYSSIYSIVVGYQAGGSQVGWSCKSPTGG